MHVIDVPHDYGISSSFNTENLVAYKGPTVIPDTPSDELFPILLMPLCQPLCP